jgi:hypothetical protein
MTVRSVRGSDQHAGVDCQHGSGAPETLGQEVIDAISDAALRSADRDKYRIPTGPGALSRECSREFRDELIEGDPAARRLGFEAMKGLRREIDGHGHGASVDRRRPALADFLGEPTTRGRPRRQLPESDGRALRN